MYTVALFVSSYVTFPELKKHFFTEDGIEHV